MESLSSYARQFLGVAKKPDVDSIEGLCPAIAIEQRTVGSNPRSTVGTITEIYDYLRVLYARIGQVHCPDCRMPIRAESPENITAMLLENFKDRRITIAAPVAHEKKGEFSNILLDLFTKGFYRLRIDGVLHRFRSEAEVKALPIKKSFKHTIDVMIDQVDVHHNERARVQEGIENSLQIKQRHGKNHYWRTRTYVFIPSHVFALR